MVEVLRLFQKMSCVLRSEHESEIGATIGTLLDDVHVELQIRTTCLRVIVSLKYFLKIRQEN